ncbi:cupredoxin domain-containing protein [Candidatus Woesearchaeota archaeon]|nr:cupredoxin domain-containing protein [Candidatus Woesearchaeota archaeon]
MKIKSQCLRWINQDSAPHTATSTGGPGSFDTGTISAGSSKTARLTTPGTYTYQCNIHPSMQGTIVVEGAQ